MTKLGALFWIGLVLASGFTTFKVKYAVQEIDDELSRVRKQAITEQQEIRVLRAEWTYLNQPDRLAEFNRVHLQLAPLTAKHLQQRIEDIAWRAPAAGSDILVAANALGPTQESAALTFAKALYTPATAAAAPAAIPAGEMPPRPAAALAAAAAVLGAGAGRPAPMLRLAKATPASLDALIARIADTR